ncbi:MAG TPA: hypothetical protein DCM28_19195 [Phycisphaerales bacterium]|nr:hypothetical protein [Phycisphaerales bacterium]HCD34035.1 hypothetical protein [Phycisphaerales bacterium]|tara:strand:+ start:285 stop:1253 length:969 start_codon:yes stop_codon:yes gene_type:complete
MENQRLPRLLELVTILQSGVGTQLYEIMDELNISRSTAFRDLKVLRDAGIPYTHEQGKGYQVNSTYYLPPVNLQSSEARALILLLKTVAKDVDSHVSADAIRALRKITCSLSVPVREVCRGLLDSVTVIATNSDKSDIQTDNVSTFLNAIDQRLCVACTYRSPADEEHDLRLHPHHLICSDCQWLLVAVVHPGSAMRTIPLTSLSQIRLTDTVFRRVDFEINQYLGKAWRWRPEGQIYQIKINVDAQHAAVMTSINWHHTQTYRMLCDGQCEMCFEVDGLKEIADWIWEYHERLTVVQPVELIEMLVDRCEQMCKRHQVNVD